MQKKTWESTHEVKQHKEKTNITTHDVSWSKIANNFEPSGRGWSALVQDMSASHHFFFQGSSDAVACREALKIVEMWETLGISRPVSRPISTVLIPENHWETSKFGVKSYNYSLVHLVAENLGETRQVWLELEIWFVCNHPPWFPCPRLCKTIYHTISAWFVLYEVHQSSRNKANRNPNSPWEQSWSWA